MDQPGSKFRPGRAFCGTRTKSAGLMLVAGLAITVYYVMAACLRAMLEWNLLGSILGSSDFVWYRSGPGLGFSTNFCNSSSYIRHIDGNINRGVATTFRLGGRIQTGGWIQASQSHLPTNSDFSWKFAHLVLKILENLQILANIQKLSLKTRDFNGDPPPRISDPSPRWRRPCK